MDILKKKALEEAIQTYTDASKEYEFHNSQFQKHAIKLYDERKKSVETILKFKEFVYSLENNSVFKTLIDQAEDIKSFQDIVRKEESGEECPYITTSNGSGTAVSGVAGAAGLATAIGGQAALWAIASSFGTTAGGTAIGTLVGIAETNAFLAWLGGGALAAGGGGIAAGSAIFAAVPVVGWAVAAIGTGTFIFKMTSNRKKNEENIQKAIAAANKLKNATWQLEKYSDKASQDIANIIEKRSFLQIVLSQSYPTNNELLNDSQKEMIENGCKHYQQLCTLINSSVLDD